MLRLCDHAMTQFVKEPFIAARSDGVYYWDIQEKRYLDAISGIYVVSVGHNNRQIIDAIKLELLMNRALRDQQVNTEQIRSFEVLINDEKEKPVEYQDRDYVFNLERQIAVLRAAQESLNRDYKDLGLKKSAMLKDMKATREQRIKRLEDSKQTFIGWVTDLMVNPEKRHELGMEMEKMRLAMDKEREALSEWHQYEDKIIDQPFLTPDSVKE